ncbi:MAG: response regulator [Candidatus Hodarchaeales archaeon]
MIDDEIHILRSLKRLFENEWYEILTAENAEEGLGVLEQTPVDMIICDQNMPGMNGLEFFQKTLPEYPDIIRIMLTGKADMDMAIEAINSGSVYKFMLKP